MRLELKVAGDPFDPGTERQVLTVVAVVVGISGLATGGGNRERDSGTIARSR